MLDTGNGSDSRPSWDCSLSKVLQRAMGYVEWSSGTTYADQKIVPHLLYWRALRTVKRNALVRERWALLSISSYQRTVQPLNSEWGHYSRYRSYRSFSFTKTSLLASQITLLSQVSFPILASCVSATFAESARCSILKLHLPSLHP